MVNAQINSNDQVGEFADFLIQEAGLSGMPEDFKITYREELMNQIQQRIGIIVLGELNDVDKEAYMNLIAAEPPSAQNIRSFLDEKIPNFDDKLSQAMQEFTREFVQAAQG